MIKRNDLVSSLSLTLYNPFIGANLVESHRSTRSEFLRRDSNLSAQSELCPISKRGWCVPIDASCIHLLLKEPCGSLILGNDRLAVSRAIQVDMSKCLINRC